MCVEARALGRVAAQDEVVLAVVSEDAASLGNNELAVDNVEEARARGDGAIGGELALEPVLAGGVNDNVARVSDGKTRVLDRGAGVDGDEAKGLANLGSGGDDGDEGGKGAGSSEELHFYESKEWLRLKRE